MKRAVILLCTGAAAAALALALTTADAQATSQTRLLAATLVSRLVGHHGLYGPAPDRALILGAWRDAGVDIRGLATPAGLLHDCQPLDVSTPRPAGPAPGDYVLYRDPTGADRIAMFLSSVDVAVVDEGAVAVVPRPELSGDVGDATVPRLLAQPGSFHACRLPATRWPGHADDTAVGVGRIALADPGQTAAHMEWAASHPRDADTSLGHTVMRVVGSALGGVMGTLEQLVSAGFSGLRHLFEWLGPAGVPFLAIAGFLGHRFDGRRLHAVLTGIVVGVLGVLLGGGFLLPLGWVLVATVLGGATAAKLVVPVLGAVGGALVGAAFAVASFLVGTVTGVDGNANVTVGTVLFALIADVLWVRPLLATFGVAARLEQLGAVSTALGHQERLLDVASHFGDMLAARPHALATVAHTVTHIGEATDAMPVYRALSSTETLGAMSRRGVDMLSLAWRPSSISSDLVGHAADALHVVDGEMRAGFPSWPRLRELVDALDPAVRDMLVQTTEHTSTHLVPQMQITARLSHLHSGARTLTGLATGNPNHGARWWSWWRSPVVQRAAMQRDVP